MSLMPPHSSREEESALPKQTEEEFGPTNVNKFLLKPIRTTIVGGKAAEREVTAEI